MVKRNYNYTDENISIVELYDLTFEEMMLRANGVPVEKEIEWQNIETLKCTSPTNGASLNSLKKVLVTKN